MNRSILTTLALALALCAGGCVAETSTGTSESDQTGTTGHNRVVQSANQSRSAASPGGQQTAFDLKPDSENLGPIPDPWVGAGPVPDPWNEHKTARWVPPGDDNSGNGSGSGTPK